MESLNGHKGESRIQTRRTWSHLLAFLGGQGVWSDPESEGFEEKYRAVINGGDPDDEQVGQRWGKVESALLGRRRYSFTHRTKVFAGGTIRKIHA
jgi:hypothetical protein